MWWVSPLPEDWLAGSQLGKPVDYRVACDPGLLYPVARAPMREALGLSSAPPFGGADIWNAYELSWLNSRGKPQVALATIVFPAESPFIVESKSLKLYLNAWSQVRAESADMIRTAIAADLSRIAGANVLVRLQLPDSWAMESLGELEGQSLDRLDVSCDSQTPDPALLRTTNGTDVVEECLFTRLFRSNCPVTGQPDWASIQLRYTGAPIDQAGLLQYLVGYRTHNAFHEQCVEQIFMDVLRTCQPMRLMVYARFTRRGGLDINPWRSNFSTPMPANLRQPRQ